MLVPLALTASLGANVSTAGLLDLDAVPGWLRILVAGWPVIAFLGGTLLAHEQPKPQEALVAKEEPTTQPPSAPELAAAEPRSAPPSTLSVPPALVAHARKVADAHHARTGTVIDTATLRARLGIPAPLAEAIAAQLT